MNCFLRCVFSVSVKLKDQLLDEGVGIDVYANESLAESTVSEGPGVYEALEIIPQRTRKR